MLQQIVTDIGQILQGYLLPNCIIMGCILCGCILLGRRYSPQRLVKAGLLILYICFVLELTLWTREPGSRIGISLTIGGTYAPDMLAQCWMVENVLMFLPLGILLPQVLPWFGRGIRLTGAAFLASLLIEVTQLVTQRGYFQVDDILLNTLGAVIAWCFFSAVRTWGLVSSLLGVVFLLLFCMIFGFSAQTGEESGGLSDRIAFFVADFLGRQLHWQVEPQSLTYPIRKTAHMTEYALLWLDGFFCLVHASGYAAHWTPDKIRRASKEWLGRIFPFAYRDWNGPVSLVLVLCVSCSDEYHQLFVPGRAGRIQDVGWDMTGVLLAVLFLLFLHRLFFRDHRRKK